MRFNFEVGDKVSVLDEAIDGTVVKVENDIITIETNDGFVMTYFVNELVKLNNFNDLRGLFSSKNLSEVIKEKSEPKKRSFVKKRSLRRKNLF